MTSSPPLRQHLDPCCRPGVYSGSSPGSVSLSNLFTDKFSDHRCRLTTAEGRRLGDTKRRNVPSDQYLTERFGEKYRTERRRCSLTSWPGRTLRPRRENNRTLILIVDFNYLNSKKWLQLKLDLGDDKLDPKGVKSHRRGKGRSKLAGIWMVEVSGLGV